MFERGCGGGAAGGRERASKARACTKRLHSLVMLGAMGAFREPAPPGGVSSWGASRPREGCSPLLRSTVALEALHEARTHTIEAEGV